MYPMLKNLEEQQAKIGRGLQGGLWLSCIAALFLASPVGAQTPVEAAPPARQAFPVENFSGLSWVGQYAADHAGPAFAAAFQRRPRLAIYAANYEYTNARSRWCVALVGLTHAPVNEKLQPRIPANLFLGAASGLASEPAEGEKSCQARAMKRAVDAMQGDEGALGDETLDRTRETGGKRVPEPANPKLWNASYFMSQAGSNYVGELLPDWFSAALDYRQVSRLTIYRNLAADNGQVVCFAYLGLSPRSAEGRMVKVPVAAVSRARLLERNQAELAQRDAECFDPMFESLVKDSVTPEGGLIKTLIENWARAGEADLQAPKLAQIKAAIERWQKSQPKPKPSASVHEGNNSTQTNSCQVNCVNGDCVRRWPNGKSERFQAPRKFNPFNSQWEWDTSGC